MSVCPPSCPRCLAGLCHGCDACKGRGAHRTGERRFPGRWVAVVGARAHGNLAQVDDVIDELFEGYFGGTVVVSGGAGGVDRHAVERAARRGLDTVELLAAWEEKGLGAGIARNLEMLAAVDEVIAFPWWGCRGTKHTISEAAKRGMKLRVVKPITKLEVWSASMSVPSTPGDLDITAKTASKAAGGTDAAIRDLLRSVAKSQERLGIREAQREAIRAGLPSLGLAWAPPYSLLGPAIASRKALDASIVSAAERVRLEDELWKRYVDGPGDGLGMTQALRWSYQDRTRAMLWGWAFAQKQIVLRCFCSRPTWWPANRPWDHCHRFLVGRALAACGATYHGELI